MITILNIIILIIVVHNSWQWRWKDCDPIEGKWSPGHPAVRRRAWRSASIKLGHFYYRWSWSWWYFPDWYVLPYCDLTEMADIISEKEEEVEVLWDINMNIASQMILNHDRDRSWWPGNILTMTKSGWWLFDNQPQFKVTESLEENKDDGGVGGEVSICVYICVCVCVCV